jgi:cell division protein FtsN
MKIKSLSFIIVCIFMMGSCKSTKKTVQSDSSYLTEESGTTEVSANAGTEIAVRSEAVKPIDGSDRTVYRYYVIIGSFRNIAGARQEKADLEKKGFSPTILENENGLYRISAGGYNDENAARAKIAGIRAAYKEHGDVWLLVRK